MLSMGHEKEVPWSTISSSNNRKYPKPDKPNKNSAVVNRSLLDTREFIYNDAGWSLVFYKEIPGVSQEFFWSFRRPFQENHVIVPGVFNRRQILFALEARCAMPPNAINAAINSCPAISSYQLKDEHNAI